MAKFFDYEHRPGEEFVLRFKVPKSGDVAAEAKSHGRTAVKEGLMAMRSLLDVIIEAVEEAEKSKAGKTRTKIEVE